VEGAVRGVPPQRLFGPVDHVLAGEHRLALGPAGDALPEGAAPVPARLARGEGRVEVHVRLDVRRGGPGAGPFDDGVGLDGLVGVGDDGDDHAAVDMEVGRADLARDLVTHADVADEQVDHEAPPARAISEVIS
jgi:hypothetical protein